MGDRVAQRAEKPAGKPPSAAAGHRARLRERLLEGGPEALADYEVLEFLLFGALARGDTKPQAKALLDKFGSLAGVFNADPVTLKQVKGVSDASVGMIKIAALAARRMARSEVRGQPVLGSWQSLIDYLSIDMAHLTIERVRVLYLDSRNRLIFDQHVHDGTVDEASIHPREVIGTAINRGASALILVHNHPSGNPEPSRADIQITRRIAEAARLVNISVHDHVIVGREGHVSLRAKGLI